MSEKQQEYGAISKESLRLSKAAAPVLRDLFIMMRNIRVMSAKHPTVASMAITVVRGLTELMLDRRVVHIDVSDRVFLLDDVPIQGVGERAAEGMQIIRKRQIGRLTFKEGVTPEELVQFLELVQEAAADQKAEQIGSELATRGIARIAVQERYAEEEQGGGEGEPIELQPLNEPRKLYQVGVDIVRELYTDLEGGHRIDLARVDYFIDNILSHAIKGDKVLLVFVGLANYDHFQYTHAVNVGILAAYLGTQVTTDLMRLRELTRAGLLHDVGKCHWHLDAVLSDYDWAPRQPTTLTHPITGADRIDQDEAIEKLASVVAFEHHLGYGMSGYPRQKRWRSINIFSSIVSICDAYDDLVAYRGEESGLTPFEAVQVLKQQSGTHFEPSLFELFAEMLGPIPVSSIVRLKTGEFAVVTGYQQDAPHYPWLRLCGTQERKFVTGITTSGEGELPENQVATDPSDIGAIIDPRRSNLDVLAML